MSEPDFLNRMFNLSELESFDRRFRDASGDIWQHRVNNEDWPDDWIFGDSRFNLLRCPDDIFLNFLCTTIHPTVRRNITHVSTLLEEYNRQLRRSGWEIVEHRLIWERPAYKARQLTLGSSFMLREVKSFVREIDSNYVDTQIARLEASISSDPELAIGQAKEFSETICKSILDSYGEKYSNSENLTALVKKVTKILKISPDDIDESAKGSEHIIKLLRQLTTIAHTMLEIRNIYGTGHGKSSSSLGFKSRHAKLVVHSAIALSEFLFETHQEKSSSL